MITPADRVLAGELLEQANRHVAEGQKRVETQLALVAKLERQGHSTLQARALLGRFEETLAVQGQTRDRIAQQLKDD